MMTTYNVYEDYTDLLGGKWHKRIGCVEARTIKSAVNKAKKEFKRDEFGRPYSEGRRVISGMDKDFRFVSERF